MNVIIRDNKGQEVFGGVTNIRSLDDPTKARNRIVVFVGEHTQEINLNETRVELLPENTP